MRAPTAPAPGPSKARSSRPVFPRATGAIAPSAVRRLRARSVVPARTKNADLEQPRTKHVWTPSVAPPWRRQKSGTFGKVRKSSENIGFSRSCWKPLKMGFRQRPVGLCSNSTLILLGIWTGAQGQNRTADTRIFNPLLYRLSYLGRRQWRKGGFLEEASGPCPAGSGPCACSPQHPQSSGFSSSSDEGLGVSLPGIA